MYASRIFVSRQRYIGIRLHSLEIFQANLLTMFWNVDDVQATTTSSFFTFISFFILHSLHLISFSAGKWIICRHTHNPFADSKQLPHVQTFQIYYDAYFVEGKPTEHMWTRFCSVNLSKWHTSDVVNFHDQRSHARQECAFKLNRVKNAMKMHFTCYIN